MKSIYTFAMPRGNPWEDAAVRLLWVYHGPISPAAGNWFARGPMGTLTVTRGMLSAETGDGWLSIRPGQTLVLPPGDRAFRLSGDLEVLSVGCQALWRDFTPFLPLAAPVWLRGERSQAVASAGRRLLRTVHGSTRRILWKDAVQFSPESLTHHAAIRSVLWKWIEVVLRAVGPRGDARPAGAVDPRVSTLMRRLSQAPLDRRVCLPDLGADLGLTWRRLEQLFKAATRKTPSEHYEYRRIALAYNLLLSGRHSVKEVAHAVGFRHQAHFTRWFSGHFGVRPSQFQLRQPTCAPPEAAKFQLA